MEEIAGQRFLDGDKLGALEEGIKGQHHEGVTEGTRQEHLCHPNDQGRDGHFI